MICDIKESPEKLSRPRDYCIPVQRPQNIDIVGSRSFDKGRDIEEGGYQLNKSILYS
jgi:hypothetical protein